MTTGREVSGRVAVEGRDFPGLEPSKNRGYEHARNLLLDGADARIRTRNRLIRSQVLYPVELHPPDNAKINKQKKAVKASDGRIRHIAMRGSGCKERIPAGVDP